MRADALGVRFLGRHMARLAASARELEIPVNVPAARVAVTHAAAEAVGTASAAPVKIRLQVEPGGRFAVSIGGMPSTPARGGNAVLASQRLDPRDPLLAHKTTRRALYDEARESLASVPDGVDVLFLNRRDQLCEGAVSNVFVILDGRLTTPPVSCGLLPGVMRGHVIEAYGAVERPITLDDLRRAERVFLTNALRGVVPVSVLA
ncbi:MAG TPA: aminotransferase class IV [Gammaproteobacteria bacterium]|nr:aminotransferase class IV [Gammaproteobacteria bacterium]